MLEGLRETLKKMRPRIIVEVRKEVIESVRHFLKEMNYRVTPIANSRTKTLTNYLYCESNKF